ncbi:MAG TPA: hypothetical protein VLS28_03680 [Candidatus Sulfomarinibacteraceae bacterium]|nr:hypothetical protein [Candidatus Sulfomarinibacteraceae bacterium]
MPAPPWRDRFFAPGIPRRLPGLLAGLVVFGMGIALMARAGAGLGPWEALHQGIEYRTGIPMGTVSILLGLPILALWWPLGERPGLGTLLNVALIGTATNAGNALIPTPEPPLARLAMMLAGVLVIGLGSGLYLAADLGPGPRDGLMTGVHHRFGWSIRRARTAIEVSVLVVAWLLGGTIGLGTIVFAFGIGPVVQVMLGVFDRDGRVSRRREVRLLEESPGSLGE